MKIKIEDLFYLYEKNNETIVALRGLFLEIQSGECLVVKGPNGSGKSTLARILSGFLMPTAGRIFFNDIDISTIDPLTLRRQYVAAVDQKGNLLPTLTIKENLVLAHSLRGFSLQASLEYVRDLLTVHNLSHTLDALPEKLSASERQMCAILAAISRNPAILIADEPSGELDNESAEKIYHLLKKCAGEMTVILVTHDSRAEHFADRIVRVRDGRISAQWLPAGQEEPVLDPYGWMQVAQPPVERPELSIKVGVEESLATLVRLENVGVNYGGHQLFHNLSLEAREGDFISVTGPSASGKSSLLRIIAGIQQPTEGEVFLQGQALKGLSRDVRAELRGTHIAFLSQGDSPVENLSIRDYFQILPGLELADFATRIKRRLARFSGGERARIEIHKMLSLGRKILIFDEPTSQLDDRQSARIAELLVNHVNEGGIAFVSTRDELLNSCATKRIAL